MMLHKSLIAIILADILYIVYCSMKLSMIPIWTLVLLAVSGFLFYVMTALVTEKMVKSSLKDGNAFCVRAGLVKTGGKELLSGILSVSSGMLMYHVRKGDLGGVRLVWSADVQTLEEYSIGKIDEYHSGIRLKLKGEDSEYLFSSRKIASMEKEFRAALGWPDEEN